MHPLLRTFNFFFLSILLGNLFFWAEGLLLGPSFIDSDLNLQTVPLLLIFSTLFSIPLLLPSAIFFFVQKSCWHNFTSKISSSLAHAVILSSGWAWVINSIVGEANFLNNLIPFVLAPPLVAIITELWYDHKHPENLEKL